MKKTLQPKNLVAVMGAGAEDVPAICRIIEEGDYRTTICRDLGELESVLAEPCMAAILDFDSVPLDNRAIRSVTHSHPATCFLCTSKERYHPDLEDSIRHHLFACLHKPVDPDELHYFLKCIRDEVTGSRGPQMQRAEIERLDS